MLSSRAKTALKALRDAAVGFAVYSGIALIALEDRAQAGNGLPALPTTAHGDGNATWGGDPSVLTLFVIGLLFAALTSFTLSVLRHFGKTFALSRIRSENAQIWSISLSRAYRKK